MSFPQLLRRITSGRTWDFRKYIYLIMCMQVPRRVRLLHPVENLVGCYLTSIMITGSAHFIRANAKFICWIQICAWNSCCLTHYLQHENAVWFSRTFSLLSNSLPFRGRLWISSSCREFKLIFPVSLVSEETSEDAILSYIWRKQVIIKA